VNALIKETTRTPFEGAGKPEALKHALAGYWSRRINDEHRLVYKVDGDSLLIAQLRYHYQ
jgi:toxin YoeB